jgi:type II secretory pathway pseudopilin PulG
MANFSRIPPRHHGFTLTEVVVALGVFIFAITAIMGIIPFGMNQVRTASNESAAMSDMESIRDDISLALASHMPTSLRYGLKIPAVAADTSIDLLLGENGAPAGNGPAVFRILGKLGRPAANPADPMHLHLRASWPPRRAAAGRETGAVELVAAFAP